MVATRAPALAATLLVAACGQIPYRTAGLADAPECRALYERHDDISGASGKVSREVASNPCWLRAREERNDYDLLFAEFDDQGWIRDSARLQSGKNDFLDEFFAKLREIHDANRENGLSLVVFVHGWHHNAAAHDSNVTEFRWLLRDLAIAENGRKLDAAESTRPRVVGIYVGWRGESIDAWGLRELTFWDRKNTADRVALGSVRELFARLDLFRDRGRANIDPDPDNPEKPSPRYRIRMLTIGHSFGGLISYVALSGDFVRAASQSDGRGFVSRQGDLVVIVNPAFEGARYEPVKVAAQRLQHYRPNQLPVAIIATSKGDQATGILFPLARRFSTLFESTTGPESEAIVRTVGHNPRYTTHELALCPPGNAECAGRCDRPKSQARHSGGDSRTELAADIEDEWKLMREIRKRGFAKKEYLCGGLELDGTPNWTPEANPFWVVSTTSDIMKDHGDIFNPRFVAFIRQMYLGVMARR